MRLHVGILPDGHALLTDNVPGRARPQPELSRLRRNGYLDAEVCRPLSAAAAQRLAARNHKRAQRARSFDDA